MFQIKKSNVTGFLFVFHPTLNLSLICYVYDLKVEDEI